MTTPLFDAAGRAYDGWPATAVDGERGYGIDVEGSNGSWSAVVLTDDANVVFCFYSLSPVDVPAGDDAALARMSEFVDRANYGLVAAAFELDRESGAVRLRSGVELATLPRELVTDDLLEAVVRDLSAANIAIMDRYLAGLVAVVMGDVPVADIVAELEQV